MRVLALTKYGSLAASTRQRFMLYEPALASAGIKVEYAPLLRNDHLERMFAGQRTNWLAVVRSYAARVIKLLSAHRYDLVWIHCELFPFLPSFLERLAAFSGKPVVFDYDDAIFHMYDTARAPIVRLLLGGKLKPLLRHATICCCGNPYLKSYAERFCPSCIILPTVVDTDIYAPVVKEQKRAPPVIGWIGTPSTWQYARNVVPLLHEFTREGRARVKIVGAGAAAAPELSTGMDLIEWSEDREVADVQSMDIGIMPVRNDEWARGKSGYKLVQYMACGLPVVASPVGVNSEMIREGVNGYLADTEEQWRNALQRLIRDAQLRSRMGAAGRARAVASYSLSSQAPRLIEVFRSAVQSPRLLKH